MLGELDERGGSGFEEAVSFNIARTDSFFLNRDF